MPRTPTSRRRRLSARGGRGRRAGALAAGCGGDDDGEDAGTDQTEAETTTTPSTTTPLTPEDEAKATYLEFVEVVDRLLTTDPDPDDPDLARLAIDPVLSEVRDSLTTLRAENQHLAAGRSHIAYGVWRSTIDPTGHAVMRDCFVEQRHDDRPGRWVRRAMSGRLRPVISTCH